MDNSQKKYKYLGSLIKKESLYKIQLLILNGSFSLLVLNMKRLLAFSKQ